MAVLDLLPAEPSSLLSAHDLPPPCILPRPDCTQSVKPPPKFKRKAVYFVKTSPARLDSENIGKVVRHCCGVPVPGQSATREWHAHPPDCNRRRAAVCVVSADLVLLLMCFCRSRPTPAALQVAHGELNEAPLETLSAVAQHVFLPLLTTSSNQEGWPDIVTREVAENLHRFVTNGVWQAPTVTGIGCIGIHVALTATIRQQPEDCHPEMMQTDATTIYRPSPICTHSSSTKAPTQPLQNTRTQ